MLLLRVVPTAALLRRSFPARLCVTQRFTTAIESPTATSQVSDTNKESGIIYEGPFSILTNRLKAVSIASAIVGAVGVPSLVYLYSGDVPALGQLAIGGTTMLTACGSTVAVNFCFAPYVHSLERVPVRKCHSKEETIDEANKKAAQEYLIKATWRNLFVMKQEVIFDPMTDAAEYKGIRPFCNFTAKGVPLFVHPEILIDDELRKQLLGEKEAARYNMPKKTDRTDEDEFF